MTTFKRYYDNIVYNIDYNSPNIDKNRVSKKDYYIITEFGN